MYSRYHKGNDASFQLPENYGGVAFSEKRPLGDGAPSARTLEVAKPSPPLPPFYHAPVPTAPPRSEPQKPPLPHATATADTDNRHTPPFSLLPIGGKEGFPFAHGIGTEELFIIALIILLSGNEQASDVVLWLTLLLFCG